MIRKRAALALALLALLPLHALAGERVPRWNHLKSGDWDPWFRFAEGQLRTRTEKGFFTARHAYETLARYDATAHGIRARYRLAVLYAESRADHAFPRAGVALLADLSGRFAHEDAQKRLEALRTRFIPLREGALQEGKSARENKDFARALSAYKRALVLPFPVRGGMGETIDSPAILSRIADTRGAMTEQVRPRREKDCACPFCRQEGFVPCPTCKGKGRVRPRAGNTILPSRRCPNCKGLKKVLCGRCMGSGISSAALTRREADALNHVMRALFKLEGEKKLEKALPACWKAVLAAGLSLPAGIAPDSVEAVRLLPEPGRRIPLDYAEQWHRSDRVWRLNLLVDVAVVTARLSAVAPLFRSLQGPGHKPRDRSMLGLTPVLPAALVAAFPADFHGAWLTLSCRFSGAEPSRLFQSMRDVVILDAPATALRLAAWRRTAAKTHRLLVTLTGKKSPYGGYGTAYPHEACNKALDDLAPGTPILLEGRLFFEAGAWPSAVFEVWGVTEAGKPVVSGEQEPPPKGNRAVEEADAVRYARRSPGFSKTTSLRRRPRHLVLFKGCRLLAEARGFRHDGRSGTRRALWLSADRLEQARYHFRCLRSGRESDALCDELFLLATAGLLTVYREIAEQ